MAPYLIAIEWHSGMTYRCVYCEQIQETQFSYLILVMSLFESASHLPKVERQYRIKSAVGHSAYRLRVRCHRLSVACSVCEMCERSAKRMCVCMCVCIDWGRWGPEVAMTSER